MLHSCHSQLPCLQNLGGEKPYVARGKKNKQHRTARTQNDKAMLSSLSSGEILSACSVSIIPLTVLLPSHKIRKIFKKLLVPTAQKGK